MEDDWTQERKFCQPMDLVKSKDKGNVNSAEWKLDDSEISLDFFPICSILSISCALQFLVTTLIVKKHFSACPLDGVSDWADSRGVRVPDECREDAVRVAGGREFEAARG